MADRLVAINVTEAQPRRFQVPNMLRQSGHPVSPGRAVAAKTPRAIARATQFEGLYLLPSGPAILSTSNLLYSNRVAELLQRVRSLRADSLSTESFREADR